MPNCFFKVTMTTKSIILLLFVNFLIFSEAFAQKKYEIGFFVSPTYSSRYIRNSSSEEKGMISYDLGALVTLLKKPNYTFATGLVYSRKGYTWEWRGAKNYDAFTFLSVPLRLSYSVNGSPYYLLTGLSNDFFLNRTVNPGGNSVPTGALEEKKYNLGVILGFGCNKVIDDKVTIGVEPTFQFQTMSNLVFKYSNTKRYMYTFGLAVNTKLNLKSQDKIATARKWAFSVIVTPTYSNRYLAKGEEFFTDEKPIVSYDAGILVTPYRKGNVSISTGLIYSRKGYSWGQHYLFSTKPKLYEMFTFLEIPIRVTYAMDQLPFYFFGGVSNDILLEHWLKVKNPPEDGSSVGRIAEGTKYNVGLTAGVGYDWIMNDRITLGFEPTLKFQTMNHSKSDLSTRLLYTIGLSAHTKLNFL